MKTLLGSWFLLGLAGTLQAEASEPQSKIQVFVYNYAGVSHPTLARAEIEATRIYGRAGIRTEWLDCPLSPGEATQYPACQLPVSPARLALRVLSREMSERVGLSEAIFGSALFPEDGGFGMVAQVCAPCVEELANGATATPPVILGYVMAHELGHLLLGVGSHAATGLMHAPWYKKELQSIAQGTLLFASWEAARMRRQVVARVGGQLPVQASRK